MPYKHRETSSHQGAFWGQNREGCTGLMVSMPWCELCRPKADNTTMVGGRGLLQWYQSQRTGPGAPARTLGPGEGADEGIPHWELRRTNHIL